MSECELDGTELAAGSPRTDVTKELHLDTAGRVVADGYIEEDDGAAICARAW